MILDLRRKLSAFLAALLVFATIAPGVACADTWISEVVYTTDTYTERNSIVVSDSPYNAASLVMGKNAILLTDEQKSYLSDPNFCPNFVDYVSTFVGIDASSIPDWVPAYMVPIVLDRMLGASTWGGGYVYASTATNFQYELAESEFNDILNGDYSSGGGSPGDYVTFSGTTAYVNEYLNGRYTLLFPGVSGTYSKCTANTGTGGNYILFPAEYTVSFPNTTAFAEFVAEHPLSDYTYLMNLDNGKNNGIASRVIYVWPNDDVSLSFTNSTTSDYKGNNVLTAISASSTAIKISFNNQRYTFDGTNIGFGTSSFYVGSGNPQGFIDNYTRNWSLLSSPVSDPEGDWPDDPQTPSPTPPELPEIDDNPVPTEPDDTDININLPDINITGGQSATDLTDVISILKVINGNLVTINDNLEAEFNSVINAFNAIGGQIEQFALRVREHCQHIRSAIYHNTTHLENQIYKLFHWLERELDYGFTGYDDTSLISYLRRILNKLSNPSKPDYQPNPIADEDNFFDWLSDLWHRFLIDLASILPESMLGLLDLFSQLTHYFPISIPWDIAAMLALFVHDPVIPVFDLPMPFAVGQTASIHIDLTPWDGVAQMVRPVFLVMFCFALAMETKKLLSHINVTEGGI